jgi:hypothetical protein
LVFDEFGVKVLRTLVIAASGCGCDFRAQFDNAAFENDLRRIWLNLWGAAKPSFRRLWT